MCLNDALAVIGVFLLGAAAGASLEYARYRNLVGLWKQLLAESGSVQAGDGTVMAGHVGQFPVEEGSTSRITVAELPINFRTKFLTDDSADPPLQTGRTGSYSSRPVRDR